MLLGQLQSIFWWKFVPSKLHYKIEVKFVTFGKLNTISQTSRRCSIQGQYWRHFLINLLQIPENISWATNAGVNVHHMTETAPTVEERKILLWIAEMQLICTGSLKGCKKIFCLFSTYSTLLQSSINKFVSNQSRGSNIQMHHVRTFFVCGAMTTYTKGSGKWIHTVDTLLPMMFLGLCKLENIRCRHKMFQNLCPQ